MMPILYFRPFHPLSHFFASENSKKQLHKFDLALSLQYGGTQLALPPPPSLKNTLLERLALLSPVEEARGHSPYRYLK